MPLVPPKLLGYILLDYGHRVNAFLVSGGGVHFVVLSEVGDVFGVCEVFFSRICCGSLLSVYKYCERGRKEEGATHFRRGISRNGGSRTHTRHHRDGPVPSIVSRNVVSTCAQKVSFPQISLPHQTPPNEPIPIHEAITIAPMIRAHESHDARVSVQLAPAPNEQ